VGDRTLREPRSYSNWYPRNSSSLTTFSCLMNTVMRRREPLPFLFAGLRYILLILRASLRLTWTVSQGTGRSSLFYIPQILPVFNPSGNSSGLAM
jgi:hypothetical protein